MNYLFPTYKHHIYIINLYMTIAKSIKTKNNLHNSAIHLSVQIVIVTASCILEPFTPYEFV